MRVITAEQLADAVAALYMRANRHMPAALRAALARALEAEVSPVGRETLARLLENAAVAAETGLPLCQDTGLAVVMAELGTEVRIDGDLAAAVDDGVRRAHAEGYLRASVVAHPLRRVNTGDNTPAILHLRLVPGDRLRLTVLPKGGGSENASALRMLKPADGAAGVIEFVVGRVSEQGVNACPPLLIGVGIGGNFEGCALLAKRALLRPPGAPNPDPDDAALEAELLRRINALGIGPGGTGGAVTALAVHVETAPCHIASLPCAVHLQCNAHRWAEVEL
ncbi:MAG TPA: fumarate hydratase [Armatimonadota bacterium]|nr:fumarate hydratase [Armatimonadota bacterium]HOS44650.1 fumarate hydratase [Armatimonadota bacterium]